MVMSDQITLKGIHRRRVSDVKGFDRQMTGPDFVV
jgi:hypothetical protein